MTETPQNTVPAPDDAELTLATPRFDAVELQTAQPVVPLAAVASRPRIWPLLLLSALLGGAVSIAALYLYQRPVARAVAQEAPTQTQTTEDVQPEPATVAVEPTAERGSEVATAEPVVSARAAEVSAPPVARPAPGRKEEKDKSREQAERNSTTRAETRGRRAEANDDARATAARRKATADVERAPHAERPRRTQPQPAAPNRTPPRNVDRIRDIFEGTPPPG